MRTNIYRLIVCLLLITVSLCSECFADYDPNKPGELQASDLYGASCILINGDTGEVMFEKNADKQRYPASTTKIMTCILGLESSLMGTVVTIPNNIAVSSDSSKMGITSGDRIQFEDLLYGMMLSSGNDAALAVAQLTWGTTNEFVRQMNLKADELGMSSTYYTNPHGLHEVNHYTTARDLATLTAYAMQNETFRKIVACTERTITTAYWNSGKTFTTRYDLIDATKAQYYAPCIGVKTGYTKAAGRCFVGACEKNGVLLITVSLNPSDVNNNEKDYYEAFADTIKLSEYGFAQYTSLSFTQMCDMCEDDWLAYEVENAARDDENNGYLRISIKGMPDSYLETYSNKTIESSNQLRIILDDFVDRIHPEFENGQLKAPIYKGQVLGTVSFTAQDGTVYLGEAVATRDVNERILTPDEIWDNRFQSTPKWVQRLFIPSMYKSAIVTWLLIAAFVVFLIARRARKIRLRNKARKAEYERKRREYLRKKKRAEYLKKHPEQRNR